MGSIRISRLDQPIGWRSLPIGAGGLIIGFDFADDKRMLCFCDTHNSYIWDSPDETLATYETIGTRSHFWRPLFTYESLRNAVSGGFDIAADIVAFQAGLGGYGVCFAPSNSNRILAVTYDLTSKTTSGSKQGVYLSNDAGASWRMVNDAVNFPTFSNALANGTAAQKLPNNKVIIDPNNPDIMYVGMPYQSGNTYPVYRSTDGGDTWDGSWCSGVISSATSACGANAMVFDRSQGTVTAFGQTVSRRMLIGVNGVGMYETFDGGVNWALTSGGPTTFFSRDIDFSGTLYVGSATPSAAAGTLWRYDIGVSAGAGTWQNLTTASGFPGAMTSNVAGICCDNRSGGEGKVWISRGLLHGYYSANANNATINNVTWVGHSGSPAGSYNAAPNDLAWTEKTRLLQSSNYQLICDANGVVWGNGTQDFWWFTMPLYANGASPAAVTPNSVGRGIEQTVTSAVLRAPGSPYVLAGMLDVGLFKKPVDSIDTYPPYQDWAWTGETVANRLDCTGLEFARSDPSFIVLRSQVANTTDAIVGRYSSYSRDYGVTWTRYSTMPDTMYNLSTHNVNGGYILAFDADRHLCVTGDTLAYVPCYTSNATSGSCSWELSDLPSVIWMGSQDLANYKLSHPIDIDHELAGTAYAYDYNTGNIWRSQNYGVNWSNVGTNQLVAGAHRPFLYTVRGEPGAFYLTAQYAASTGKLWKYVNGGTDASPIDIPLPGGSGSVYRIALGAPKPGNSNPALYLIQWTGFNTQMSLWRSDAGDGSDWVQFGGVLQAGMPSKTQLDGPRIFAADWVEYGRIYLGSWGSGFSFFSA